MNVGRIVDLGVVVVYLLGILSIGARFLRRTKTTSGFTVGSRTIPAWAIGISVLAVFVSSISFVGNAGKAFSDNWAPFLFALTVVIVAAAAARWFVPLYRSFRDVSAYALLERRFGYWARAFGSSSFQVIQLARIGVILYLLSLVVAPVLEVPSATVILVVGVLVVVYTMLGGIEGVIWTDVIQVFVMFGGAVWCLITIFWLMPGGALQVFELAWKAGGKFDLGEYSMRWENQTFLGVLLFGILANLQNFGADQNYVQRYHAAKSEADAKRAVLIGAFPFVPVTALFLMIGTSLFSFYRVYPELLPSHIRGDAVFPYFISTRLPAGVRGLLVASILAAAMSAISSSLNCVATVFLKDFYCRLWRQCSTEKEQVRVLRVLTALCGGLGMGVSFLMVGAKSGLDLFWEISAVAGSTLLGLFMLAILRREVNQSVVRVATGGAIVFLTWAVLSREFHSLPLRLQLDPLLAGAGATIVLVTSTLVVSRLLTGRSGVGPISVRRGSSA
jgi:SSS family solute:Na+ symporter